MSRNNSYLYLTGLTVADTFGNLNLRVPPSQAIQALLFTPDKTPPSVCGIRSRHEHRYLYAYVLGDCKLSDPVPLRGPYANVSTPFNVIKVVVNNNDLNAIKALTPLLATSVPGQSLHQLRHLPRHDLDTTPPQLLSFSIDMNKGQLTLNFSETVQSGTLDPKGPLPPQQRHLRSHPVQPCGPAAVDGRDRVDVRKQLLCDLPAVETRTAIPSRPRTCVPGLWGCSTATWLTEQVLWKT
eukprot:Em0012g1001a